MNRASTMLTAVAGILMACSGRAVEIDERMGQISLPPGFKISIYAAGLEEAREMALGNRGTVFVGSCSAGRVYALQDMDADGVADRKYQFSHGLNTPSGVAFRDGALYVADLDRILRYDDIESFLDRPPEPDLLIADMPDRSHHSARYLRFGPDQHLYVAVGAPCNICDEPGFGQIRRIDTDGGGSEVYASGIRNSVGMAFHPESGELWFTDNGRDWLGDDAPSDELNHVTRPGQHFGFPYCHQGDLPDPEFGRGKSCDHYRSPAVKLGAHVAALGLAFYTGSLFPADYRGGLFIARHGSWNRSQKVGYDVALVRFDATGRAQGPEVFARGWLRGQDDWGRPNDILQLPDGSLLISDDKANAIYRISFVGN